MGAAAASIGSTGASATKKKPRTKRGQVHREETPEGVMVLYL